MSNPEVVTQRRLGGAPIEKPAVAKNSVFDNDTAKPRLPRLDVASIVIKKGVPIPAAKHENSPYKALAEKTKSGDSWEMNKRHASSFASYCKKHDIKIQTRQLGNDMVGVWRV